jgi:hypothetical protein
MTIEKRIQTLEAVAATHENAGESIAPWLTTAPEPVQRHVAALVDEYWTDVDEGIERSDAAHGLLERHPLFHSLRSRLELSVRAGEAPNLRRVQAHLLYIAGRRLPFYPWSDPHWERWWLIQRNAEIHLNPLRWLLDL